MLGEDNVTKTEKVNRLNQCNNVLNDNIQSAEQKLKSTANIVDIKTLDSMAKLDSSTLETKRNRVSENDKIIKNSLWKIFSLYLVKYIPQSSLRYTSTLRQGSNYS